MMCGDIHGSVYLGTAKHNPPVGLARGATCAGTTVGFHRVRGDNGTTAFGPSWALLLHLGDCFALLGIQLEPPKDLAGNL